MRPSLETINKDSSKTTEKKTHYAKREGIDIKFYDELQYSVLKGKVQLKWKILPSFIYPRVCQNVFIPGNTEFLATIDYNSIKKSKR